MVATRILQRVTNKIDALAAKRGLTYSTSIYKKHGIYKKELRETKKSNHTQYGEYPIP